MNEFIYTYFGEGSNLNTLQMCSRAFVIFFISLLLIRIAGRRSFAVKSPFDNIIVILLGSVLSRAVTGVSPFWPTVISSFLLVIVYRSFALLSLYSPGLSNFLKGNKMVLFHEGKFNESNLKRHSVSKEDLMQGLRKELHTESLQNVHKVYIETSGEISIVRKEDNPVPGGS